MSKALKITIIAIVAIVLVLVIATVYRMMIKFNRKKVKAYAEDAAAKYTLAPNIGYRLIIENTELILKSQDLCKAVEITADCEGIEKEQALVNAALMNCFKMGFIPEPEITQ